GDDREQDDLLVEGLVVREVPLQDQRRAIDNVGREGRRAAPARWFRTLHLIEDALRRDRDLPPSPPAAVGSTTRGTHEEKDAAADRERHPAAVRDLDDVGAEKCAVDREECTG